MTSNQKRSDGQGPKGSEQMARFSNIMQKQMVFFFPIIMFFILLRLPAAIGLYWTTTSLFSIFQQRLIFKKMHASSN
jgi:YidC/Oxa1 family membrane protein insertase